MSAASVSSPTITNTIFNAFVAIQSNPYYPKTIRILKRCLLESKTETFRSFNQLILQLFSWQHKSQRLGRVYTLIRKFIESCTQTTPDLNSTPTSTKELATLRNSALDLAKELLLISCYACNAPSYLMKVRASCVIRN